MPEQQANPSYSQPQSIHPNDPDDELLHDASPDTDAVPQPAPRVDSSLTSADPKRTYLSLLPPPQLIDLILAIEANRQTVIFPHDLDSAIRTLQRSHRQSSIPSPPPLEVQLQLPQQQETASTPELEPTPTPAPMIIKAESTVVPVPQPLLSQPSPIPTPTPPVQPPQYKPPTFKQPHAPVYPYTHTPYYPPPQPPFPHPAPSPHMPPTSPAAPARHHPLFTSTPLSRDPAKTPLPRPTPPPLVSSRDDPNAMPSYEEMIVEAIMDVGDIDGTAPKVLFSWMASHYPLQQNFRPSASQALHKALKRGRLEKIGGKYRLDPTWGGGPTTSKRATRRPTANRALSPPIPHPPGTGAPGPPGTSAGPILPPGYPHQHPPPPGYSYPPYPHLHPQHPSLQHSYATYNAVPNGGYVGYGPGSSQSPWQPLPLPLPFPMPQGQGQSQELGQDQSREGGEMEDDEEDHEGLESEVEGESGMEGRDVNVNVEEEGEVVEIDEKKREQIRQSLIRLARVLRRFAKKGKEMDNR